MIHDADPRPAMVRQKADGSLPLDELLAQKQMPSAQTNIQPLLFQNAEQEQKQRHQQHNPE